RPLRRPDRAWRPVGDEPSRQRDDAHSAIASGLEATAAAAADARAVAAADARAGAGAATDARAVAVNRPRSAHAPSWPGIARSKTRVDALLSQPSTSFPPRGRDAWHRAGRDAPKYDCRTIATGVDQGRETPYIDRVPPANALPGHLARALSCSQVHRDGFARWGIVQW